MVVVEVTGGVLAGDFITISDLYKAYRKAKSDAFFDKTHFSSIAFSAYEQRLEQNLARLLERLVGSEWFQDINFIGGYSYLPKSIDSPSTSENREIQFATLDPVKDWGNICRQSKVKVKASFRLVMRPTVDYQVVSALWIIKVGEKFDRAIDRRLSFAHELRRVGNRGDISMEAPALFVPYIAGYRNWRSRGLSAMRNALNARKAIAAMTMDVERFYHRVSPKFLTRKTFLDRVGVTLSEAERGFTEKFISSIDSWYASTPDFQSRKEGALPVGLSASRVISNVLLSEFDKVMSKRLDAIYYGRYADDIFLVIETPNGVDSGEKLIRWLRKRLEGWLVLDQDRTGSGLKLKLPYAKDSEITFASKKQKIFFLSGAHGFDLVDQIVEKIKEQSSEFRLLPELPESESKMVAQALLASPDARLEADALRKAEAVSIRRLNFSMLLGDVEAYARDLAPSEWRPLRHSFYGLVSRYVLTPVGLFDYFVYLVKVFALMVSSNDIRAASEFIKSFEKVVGIISRTSTAGGEDAKAFELAVSHYKRGFAQVAYEAASVARFRVTADYIRLLSKLQGRRVPLAKAGVKAQVLALLKADLGRRPYHQYWIEENRSERGQPPLPSDFSVRRVLVLTKQFRGKIAGGLNAPYWPAVAFPTRPIPLWSLTVAAPDLMFEPGGIEKALWATRGAKVNPRFPNFAFVSYTPDGSHIIDVPHSSDSSRKIGVPSYLTSNEQFEGAISGKPDRSLKRYKRIRGLVNRILKESPDTSYVAFPEVSLPLDWALGIAKKLGERGVSFIAGIENSGSGANYTNDALVSLASNYFGRRGAVCFVQRKIDLAHEEAKSCEKYGKKYVKPPLAQGRPLYIHGGLCIGVLVCSDLTTIAHRAYFQGKVDLLFVLEWNKDVTTFEFLVESAAHDLHAAVVQINNRQYGDSRIRVPFERAYLRDVVRVKGGDEDFYVVSTIDFAALRAFQRNPAEGGYKPVPIGYEMSAYRKGSKLF